MISAPTCLVLGAGASAPYGLPPAGALRDLILVSHVPNSESTALLYPPSTTGFASISLDTSPEKKGAKAKNHWLNFLNDKCAAAGFSGPAVQEFRTAFFNAKRQSIDKFLQFNADRFGEIGRVNIAAVILARERPENLDKDWYAQLLEEITPALTSV